LFFNQLVNPLNVCGFYVIALYVGLVILYLAKAIMPCHIAFHI